MATTKSEVSQALRGLALTGACALLTVVGCTRLVSEIDFLADSERGYVPHTVQFTPITDGEVRRYLWSFGDGSTSTEARPEHTYTYVGAYSITLLVQPRRGEPVAARKDQFIQVGGLLQAGPIGSGAQIVYENRSFNSHGMSVVLVVGSDNMATGACGQPVAWRVLPRISRGSMMVFDVASGWKLRVVWGSQTTDASSAVAGQRYVIKQDPTGIILETDGAATSPGAIEVVCGIEVEGVVHAQLLNDGKVALTQPLTTQGEIATFVLPNKLYWLVTREIQEGALLDFATLGSDTLFEQDITGLSSATVTLSGNPKDGFQFDTPTGDV